ncbi:teichoic acid transporter, partial [Halobacteriales archaeon QS_9_67_15]
NLLYVAMNVGLNLVLVTLFGWYGAAFATAISSLVNIVVAGYALTTIIGRPEIPVKQLGYQITASLVMFVVVAALRGPLPDTLGWTLANVAVGALVYAVALFGLSSRVRGKVTGLVQA